MTKIRLMPDALANQIAAGEVVERPASVVKELVENSLDAGAQSVFVLIEKSGKDRIRVVDDGIGMSPEDARLALERHATSKLFSTEDLVNISTLGFRGEALPSIASVSHFTLQTREASSNAGYELSIERGRLVREGELGLAPGTIIDVRRLFENVPRATKVSACRRHRVDPHRSTDVESRGVLSRRSLSPRARKAHAPRCALGVIEAGAPLPDRKELDRERGHAR